MESDVPATGAVGEPARSGGQLLLHVHQVVKEVRAGEGGRPQSARSAKLPMRRMGCRSGHTYRQFFTHSPTPSHTGARRVW